MSEASARTDGGMWPTVAFKRVATVTLGKMLQPEPTGPDDVEARYIRAANVQPDGKLVDVDEKTMWFRPGELQVLDLRAGDVVVVEGGVGGYGRSATLDRDWTGWGFQNSINRLRPFPTKADGRFLDYVLQHMLASGETRLIASASTMPHFTAEKLAAVKAAMPPVEAQRAIADFLDRETAQIDAMVDAQERLVALLEERREAAITAAVTTSDAAQCDHPSPTPWYDRIPPSWRLVRVAGLVDLLTDGAHISPDTADPVYDFVSTRDVRNGEIDFDGALKTSSETYTYMVRTGCQPTAGDVLFSKDGTVGRTALVKDNRDFVVASSLIIVRPQHRIASGAFLNYAFQSRNFQEQALASVRGAGLPRISVSNFGKAVVLVPPLDEQDRIVARLEAATVRINAMIAKALESIALMKERRAALIGAAVTGRIDVRTGIEQVERDLEEVGA